MITIHKYVLGTAAAEVEIGLPKDAQLLSVHLQGTLITLWAKVDTSKPYVIRSIEVVGTGWDLDTSEITTKGTFIGTVLSGRFVWHVFDMGEI